MPFLVAIAAPDALAFAMVAMLSFALGMIVTILFVMARSISSPPDVDPDLFDDEDEDGEETTRNVEAGDPPADSKEAWEQDPDWWKK